MRTRILITNGEMTLDLFWVEHTGSDVYCGMTDVPVKKSYHGSGQVHHTDAAGVRMEPSFVTPLKELNGWACLMSMSIPTIAEFSNRLAPHYTGGRADAVLIADVRTLRHAHSINITVGVVEPYAVQTLRNVMSETVVDASWTIGRAQQLLLATGEDPWVWVTVNPILVVELDNEL
jgi:hypothetical protein